MSISVTLDRNSLLVLFEAIRSAVFACYLEDDHRKLMRAIWPQFTDEDLEEMDLCDPGWEHMTDEELLAAYPRLMRAYCQIEWGAEWHE